MDVLQPRRAELARALAVVTHSPATWWREQLTGATRLRIAPLGPVVDGEALRELRRDGVTPWAIRDPREAWEAMATAGLIPHDAVEDSDRVFVCPTCAGSAKVAPVVPAPRTRADLLALDDRLAFATQRTEDHLALVHPKDLARLEADAEVDRVRVRRLGDSPRTLRVYGLVLIAADLREEGVARVSGVESLLCEACDARGLFLHPPTVADCVAFAADWAGVLRAEEIAREVYRAALGWDVLGAARWRVVAVDALTAADVGMVDGARVHRAMRQRTQVVPPADWGAPWRALRARLPADAAEALHLARAAAAADEGLRPLGDLLALGYALGRATGAGEPSELVAPAL